MTLPSEIQRLLQEESTNIRRRERRPGVPDEIARLLDAEDAAGIDPVTRRYEPPKSQLYGEGNPDEPSLVSKIARLPLALGKSMLESVDIAPELHGGEGISRRQRLARVVNLATLPLPLAAPFKVAKYASIGKKALMAGAGSAVVGGVSAAIEGAPVAGRAVSGGVIGAGLETGLSLLTRGRLRARGAASKASFSDPQAFNTAFHSDDWALTSPQLTRADRRLSPQANAKRLEEARADLEHVGLQYTEGHGYKAGSRNPDASILMHGVDDAKAVEVARQWDQDWVVTKRGKYNLKENTLEPITGVRYDSAVLPSDDALELVVNGQQRKVAFDFGAPQPVAPRVHGPGGQQVKYGPDEELFKEEPNIAAKARLAIAKGVRYVKGMEDAERFIGAKESGLYDLPSKMARQDATGLAETSVEFDGVYSFYDRTFKHYDKSLKQIVKRLAGNEVTSFEDYLVASTKILHDDKTLTAQNMLAAGNAASAKAAAGPTLQPWDRIHLAQLKQQIEQTSPHFKDIARELNEWRNAHLEWLYEAGTYSRQEVDALKLDRDGMIPLRELKIDENLLLDDVLAPRLEKLDLERTNSPLQNLVMESYVLANHARRGQVAATFVNWLESVGPDVARMFAEPVGKSADLFGDSLRSGVNRQDNTIISGMSALEPDMRSTWLLKDPSIIEMFKAMEPAEMGLYTKLLAPVAHMLRTTATLAFEFLAKNPLRDLLFGKVTSGAFMKDFASAFVSAFTKDAKYQEALRGGAFRSELIAQDLKVSKHLIEKWTGTETTGQKLLNVVKTPYEALKILSLGLEQSTRLGAYKRGFDEAVAQGMHPDRAVRQAALKAKDVSVDFGMYGSRTAPIRLTTAFWNAMIQGQYRLGEVAAKDPVGVMARGIGMITVPSVLFYLRNRQDPEYAQLPSWEKTLFWHTKIGDQWVRFPKPFEVGVFFGSTVERVLEALDQNDPSIVDSFAADYIKGIGMDLIPMPTAIKPFVENSINKSFLRQRPIVSAALQDVEPKYQIQPGTSNFAQNMGAFLGVSPVKVDNVIGNYFAGLGKAGVETVSKVKDIGEAVFDANKTLKDQMPALDMKNTWLLKGFASQYPRNAEVIDKLYKFVDKARTAAETSDHLEKSMRLDDLSEWLEKKAVLAGMSQSLQPIITQLAQLRAERARIYLDESIAPREQRRQLEELDRTMLNIANSVYEGVKQFDQPK